MDSIRPVNPILLPFSIVGAIRLILQKAQKKRRRRNPKRVETREIHAFCVKFTHETVGKRGLGKLA